MYEFLYYATLALYAFTVCLHIKSYKMYTTVIHSTYESLYERQRTLSKLITTVSCLNTDLLQLKGEIKVLKRKLENEIVFANTLATASAPDVFVDLDRVFTSPVQDEAVGSGIHG